MFTDLNHLAILTAAVAKIAIGYVWYSPFFLGGTWLRLMQMENTPAEQKKERERRGMVIGIIGALVMAYALAYIIQIADATTADEGVILGVYLWLGFVATVMATQYAYGGKPLKLYMIDVGYQLLTVSVMAVTIAVW